MSDTSAQSKHKGETATTEQTTRTSACPHPEAVGTRWGDLISSERRAELQGYLDQWSAETDHGARVAAFAYVQLTGADARWLAEQSERTVFLRVPYLHLEKACFSGAHLEGANLSGAHLEGADLSGAHLETLYVNPLKSETLQ